MSMTFLLLLAYLRHLCVQCDVLLDTFMVYIQFSCNKRSDYNQFDFALFNVFPLFVILCDILSHFEIHFRSLSLY